MEKEKNDTDDILSAAQQKFLEKKKRNSNGNKGSGNFSIKKSAGRTTRPFLIFFCLLVSPAVYDQFAPFKTKVEIVQDVNYGAEVFRYKNSTSRGYVLNIITSGDKYKFFGSYYDEYHQISRGDTLKITKTQILSIPKNFKSARLNFDYHAEDYYVFYSSLVVVFLFLLSFFFKRRIPTTIIFVISITCTLFCVGMYL